MVKNKIIKVALAGNPNSGKTSLFNELVGTNLKVGNWSGVTIERYEGKLKYGGYTLQIVDLPGTYSLTAYSAEEKVAREFLVDDAPDVVVNVVDGTNLERNLYLTTQLMELESDLVIALNMYDEVESQKIKIDLHLLEQLLGTHVVPTSSVTKQGLTSLLDHVIRVYEGNIRVAKNKLFFSERIESWLSKLTASLAKDDLLAKQYHLRWLAIKLLESDQQVYSLVKERAVWIKLEPVLIEAIGDLEKIPGSNLELMIAEDRHSFVRGALAESVQFPSEEKLSLTDRIDALLINRVLGLPIFFGFMWLVFQMTFRLGEIPMGWIESSFEWLAEVFTVLLPEGLLQSVIVDGIIAGVGGVVVFLPNILLLFLAISFLEGTGYMARAAFVVDKVLHKFGLHGKSFIPMITGFGCSVPAFMSCRTLKSESDRITTMFVIPFMSCGAKLPVYVLLIGAFFPAALAGNVLFGIYMFGVVMAVLSAKLLKTTVFKGESEPFVMELPPYRLPKARVLLMQMWQKAKLYLRKAGTLILAASVIIWVASNFPVNHELEGSFDQQLNRIELNQMLTVKEQQEQIDILKFEQAAGQLEYSVAGRVGKFVEPVIRPLGFDWRIGVALVSGLAAKEIVVSTLGTIYALGVTDEDSTDLAQRLASDPNFDIPTALALMIFVLLYVPCVAATVVFHKEANNSRWTFFYIAYSMTVAWLAAFVVYNLANFFIS